MQPLLLAAIAALAASAAAEQHPPPPPTAPAGTIRGIVLAGDGNTTLRGARVAHILDSGEPVVVFADANGAFEMRQRPVAGVLKITKAGYAPAVVPAQAQAEGMLRVLLDRAAVVTGNVMDAGGNAMAAATVAAERLDSTREQAAADAVSFKGRTNELGEFRIWGLPAGRYAVSVEGLSDAPVVISLGVRTSAFLPLAVDGRGRSSEMRRLSAATALVPPGSVSGVVRDAFGDPLENVGVRLWERVQVDGRTGLRSAGPLVYTDDRGVYRLTLSRQGMAYVAAEIDDRWIDAEGAARSYLAELYPGGPRSAEWTPIEVVPGRNVEGIDITFNRTPAPAVSGMVRDADGRPVTGRVVMVPRGSETAVRFGVHDEPVRPDGSFMFNDVAPGDYVVQATKSSPELSSNVLEFGIAGVTVSAAGAPPVLVSTSPVVSVSGRVTFEGDQPAAPAPRFTVYTQRDGDYAGGEFGAPTVSIQPDLSFRVRGLAGPTRFVLSEAPPGWWLKAANVGGINAAETPVVFEGGGARDDVALVLSRTAAVLTGRVIDRDGGTRSAYTVVVFADDERQWYEGSARVKTAGAAFADSSFRVHSLPPGDYLVTAIPPTRMEHYSVDWPDYEMLGRLRAGASRISLRENEQRFVELRVMDVLP